MKIFFQGSDSDDCVNDDALDPEATTPKEIASDKVWVTVMTVTLVYNGFISTCMYSLQYNI